MLFRVIDKEELPALVEGFMRSYEVIGPVQKGEDTVFAPVAAFGDLELAYTSTLNTAKQYLLPSEEQLVSYVERADCITEAPRDATPQVLFGLHACDINAINRLDTVFCKGEFFDPYYRARREATVIVGISCFPSAECFCVLWGTDEVNQGYDLFLYDIGDKYLVSMYSVKGAEMLEGMCNPRIAEVEDKLSFQLVSKRFREGFRELPDIDELPMLMDALHKDPFWDELGERCLSCTACSATCPTCYCFDIIDVPDMAGTSGVRNRVWDSCCNPDFARVAHGGNFRPTARNRVRHRFYHKLLAYLTKHGQQLCVGCGRCIRSCKADINPLVVIEGLYRNRDRALEAQKSTSTALHDSLEEGAPSCDTTASSGRGEGDA